MSDHNEEFDQRLIRSSFVLPVVVFSINSLIFAYFVVPSNMHVNGLYNRILCTDKIRIFCPIQNLKTDSESAENFASNCVFEIF